MFESNMMQNIMLAKIQGDASNTWLGLVSSEYLAFLNSIASKDAITTKQQLTEGNENEE